MKLEFDTEDQVLFWILTHPSVCVYYRYVSLKFNYLPGQKFPNSYLLSAVLIRSLSISTLFSFFSSFPFVLRRLLEMSKEEMVLLYLRVSVFLSMKRPLSQQSHEYVEILFIRSLHLA